MSKKKMGRPAIEIDKGVFENLCSIQCTEEEIAGVFNCSIDTINRWCKKTYEVTFAEIYKSKSAKGKMSLRRWQFDTAKRGNATMQIWLGRQYLGQADKQEIENVGDDNNITINITPATPIEECDDEE